MTEPGGRSSPRSSPTSASRLSKFVAFAVTGSASMLAESIHSVADTGNQGLLFLGGRRSRRAPTAEHPFGFGQERYFWAFVVALVLFSLGSLFALAEGVDKLRNPEHLDSPVVAYVVLGVAIVLEALSLRTAHREALPMREEHARGGTSSAPRRTRRSRWCSSRTPARSSASASR